MEFRSPVRWAKDAWLGAWDTKITMVTYPIAGLLVFGFLGDLTHHANFELASFSEPMHILGGELGGLAALDRSSVWGSFAIRRDRFFLRSIAYGLPRVRRGR